MDKDIPDFIRDWMMDCKKRKKCLSYAIHAPFLRNYLLEKFGDDDNRVRWLDDPSNQELFAANWLGLG